MPLSEVQLSTPPFKKGKAWRDWWLEHGVKKPSGPELRAWLAKVEREKEQGKALLAQRREEAKAERKRIR